MLAKYSVTYSAIDTKGINYFYIKILHLAFLHCAGPETDHVTYRLIEMDENIKLPPEEEGKEFGYFPFEELPLVTTQVIV